MNALHQAIIQTLCYADIFDFPLTGDEVHHRLISDQPFTKDQVTRSLIKLVANRSIGQKNSLYFLTDRQDIIHQRMKRQAISNLKRQKAKSIADNLMKLPYLKAVWLTGAAAVFNADEGDDIDLMIICEPLRLWTTRLIVTIYLEILGIRRHPHSRETANKICPNLFVTTVTLKVPLKLQSLYTAHEVAQAVPLAGAKSLHRRFMIQNHWISQYLPNVAEAKVLSLLQNPFSDKIGWVEQVVKKLQYLYMGRKITREITTDQSAYFHPRDTAGIVLAEYRKRLKTYVH